MNPADVETSSIKIKALETRAESGCAEKRERKMFGGFGRRRFLSFPLVIGAAVIGVVSGKAIFGPPLEEYWKNKLEEEAAVKKIEDSAP